VLAADPEGAAAIVGEARVDIRAIVSVGDHFGGRAVQISQEVAPLVLVEAEGVEPGPRLSTTGGTGVRHDQAGFLAGVMVGLGGASGWVGLVEETGGPQEALYRAGFEAGVRYGCPKCRLITTTAGEAAPDSLRVQGVEFLFVIPGPAAGEAAAQLAAGELQVVWVGELPTPELQVAGQVVFAAEPLIEQALEGLLAGQAGMAWSYAIENGGIRLGEIDPDALSPGRQRLLQEAYEAVAAGRLDLGIDPATGEQG
jgi:basic membrane lipoprotein Med (substrate-binding protein (PBP1-ABC) superfamily)